MPWLSFFFLVASELEGNIFHWKKLGEGESKPDIFVARLIQDSYFHLDQNYPF